MNKQEKSLGLKNSITKDQEKEITVVWTRGKDEGEKITKCSFTWTCRGKEKQRETDEDLDGQCQGRPEREEHRTSTNPSWSRIGEATRNRKVWRNLVRASSSA